MDNDKNIFYFIAGPIAAGKSTFMENRLYNATAESVTFFDHDREKLMIQLYAPAEKKIVKELTIARALSNAIKDSLVNKKDFLMQAGAFHY